METQKNKEEIDGSFALIAYGEKSTNVFLVKNHEPCVILVLDSIVLAISEESASLYPQFIQSAHWQMGEPEHVIKAACLEECWRFLISRKQEINKAV